MAPRTARSGALLKHGKWRSVGRCKLRGDKKASEASANDGDLGRCGQSLILGIKKVEPVLDPSVRWYCGSHGGK